MKTGTACDGIWMQLIKSVLNFYFFSDSFCNVPRMAYMLVWNLSQSITDGDFIIAAEFAYLHIRQVWDWWQVTYLTAVRLFIVFWYTVFEYSFTMYNIPAK